MYIDSCSEASLISETCVKKLGLSRSNVKVMVSGLGQQAAGTTLGFVMLLSYPPEPGQANFRWHRTRSSGRLSQGMRVVDGRVAQRQILGGLQRQPGSFLSVSLLRTQQQATRE